MSRVTRRRNYYIKRPHTLKGPKQTLIVETVSMCNLKCPMCEQSFEKRPGKGVMSFDLWKSIMDELASTEARINCLNPFWSGEALLHPEIIRMLAYAKEVNKEGKAFSTMDLHTNGNLLSEEISQEIVNGGLFERVLISIDAASPETYERMRTGGDFDRVVRNVKTLLDIRDRFSRELPRLTLQFVVSGVNFHEASLFVKYWGEEFSKRNREYQVNYDWNRPEPLRKDAIFLKRLDTVDDLLQVEAEKLHREVARQLGLVGSEKSSRIVDSDEFRIKDGIHLLTGEKEPPRPPCVGLWTHFAIKWDGEVTACCRDIRCELGLGKYGDMSIAEFLNCELLTNYRLAHIKGEFGRVPRCTYCQGQVSPRLEHDEVITYLESISREDLIPFYRKRMKLEPC